MNTEFIQSLIQQLSLLNRLIFSRTASLREKAMSVRKATEVLPVELSVVIASSAISDACYDMYAKILEIAILLFICENSHDFSITQLFARESEIMYHVSEKVEQTPRFALPRGYRIPDNWLELAVRDIVNGPMWSRVMLYIYDDNVVEAILEQEQHIHMNTDSMHHILAMIAPTSFDSLYSLRVDSDVGTEQSEYVLYKYLKSLHFRTWVDFEMKDFLEAAAEGHFA